MRRQLRAMRFLLRDLGLLGWLGVGLILGALAYAAVAVPQRNAEVAALQGQIDRLQAKKIALAHNGGEVDKQKSATADLPAVMAAPKLILALEDMARKEGLDVKRNDYRYVDPVAVPGNSGTASRGKPVTSDHLLEVHITTPASGNYVNLRAFLSHALEQLPTLALDDVSLKRETIANGNLQALLRFTLFVRNEP